MGWKTLKEKFGIKHYVQTAEEGVCIGSGYVSDLITIDATTGEVRENPTFSGFLRDNYPGLRAAAPEDILKLLQMPDTFSTSIAVYTYEGGEILEKYCETPGWPNATHDGCMMYENKFSTDKATVIAWAKRNASIAVKHVHERIAEVENDLVRLRKTVAEYQADLAKLEAMYPTAKQD